MNANVAGKPVRSIKNQYAGINAHLHSLLQGQGGWNGFHSLYLSQLLMAHQFNLEQMGYSAEIEQSLQIRRVGDSIRRPKADMLVFDKNVNPSVSPPVGLSKQVIPLAEVMDDIEEDSFPAIVIYEHNFDTLERGEPVVWIELLSPTNKGDTPDAAVYNSKRRDVLKSGLVFVEIDFLHETPPTFKLLSADKPYRILVIDPRPRLAEGKLQFDVFDIDDPTPNTDVPLNRGDQLTLDFATVYTTVFQGALYGNRIDYARYPLNFDRYTLTDQTRIANRMVAVLEAAHAGVDLETGAFPLPNLTLEDAQNRIAALTEV